MMGPRGRLFSFLLLALLAGLSGCASLKTQRLNTALEASVKTYGKLMRWGHYEEAAEYFRPQDESIQNSDISRLARFRVTSYDVATQLIADTGTDAHVVALIGFYGVDSGIVKSVKDEQSWWYDEGEQRWYLGSPMPDFSTIVDR